MSKFEREVEIDTPIAQTWSVLIDANQWPKWFPYIDSITSAIPLGEGAVVRFVSGNQAGTATVTKFVPEKELTVLTEIDGDQDKHTFSLRSSGGFFGLAADEANVEYKLDTMTAGGMLGRFVTGGNPRDLMRVKSATNALRKLVEAQFPK